jgi:hypothetical protein
MRSIVNSSLGSRFLGKPAESAGDGLLFIAMQEKEFQENGLVFTLVD